METLKYRFNLDCNKIGIQRTLQGIQTGDVMARQCVISLTAGSTPVEFPTDDSVVAMMYVKTPSAAEPSINACEVNQTAGTVTYDILESDIAEAGIVTMQVKVLAVKNGVERVLVAPKFELEIEESDVSDSEAETSPSFTALEQAIAKAQEVYNSRLISVTVNEEHIIVVTYADGTTYESTGLIDTYRDLMDDTYGNFYTEIAQAELFKTEAATSAGLAAEYRDEARTSKEAAALSAQEAADTVDTTQQIKDSALAELTQIKDSAVDAMSVIKDEAISGTQQIVDDAIAEMEDIHMSAKDFLVEQANTSESFATGNVDGIPVSEGHPAYHNNARYYAELAGATASSSYVSFGAEQGLTEAQQLTARKNISAPSRAELSAIGEALADKANKLKSYVAGNLAQIGAGGTYEDSGYMVGEPNGIATLDGSGRIPFSQLPESAMEYKGSWNASTNTPAIANGTGTNGDFYIVSVGGTWNGTTFVVNDRIIYDGTTSTWQRLGSASVINSLSSASTTSALSAAMGRYLNDVKMPIGTDVNYGHIAAFDEDGSVYDSGITEKDLKKMQVNQLDISEYPNLYDMDEGIYIADAQDIDNMGDAVNLADVLTSREVYIHVLTHYSSTTAHISMMVVYGLEDGEMFTVISDSSVGDCDVNEFNLLKTNSSELNRLITAMGGGVNAPYIRNTVFTTTDQTAGASSSYPNGTIIAVYE